MPESGIPDHLKLRKTGVPMKSRTASSALIALIAACGCAGQLSEKHPEPSPDERWTWSEKGLKTETNQRLLVDCLDYAQVLAQGERATRVPPPQLVSLVDACKRERSERAPRASLDDLKQVPKDQLLAVEEARIDRLRKERDDSTAELERLKTSRDLLHLAHSAKLCRVQEVRAGAKNEIRLERKYAAEGGGVVDQRKLYELQQQMRESDEQAAASIAALRDLSRKPLSCETAAVQRALYCVAVDLGETVTPPDGPNFDCDAVELIAAREVVEDH
jgi:hypothetical protein